jgi:hypothetical protein
MPEARSASTAASECCLVRELWLLSTIVVVPAFRAWAAVNRSPIATSSGR